MNVAQLEQSTREVELQSSLVDEVLINSDSKVELKNECVDAEKMI